MSRLKDLAALHFKEQDKLRQTMGEVEYKNHFYKSAGLPSDEQSCEVPIQETKNNPSDLTE
jgi:hypothetical protein